MKKKAGCYEWWDKPKKPEKYFNWWEKKEKNGLLHKEGYIPVKCPSTKREYHVPFNPETDNIKDLKCPLCGRKIYRKKKKGRPAIYSEVEQEILNKCKHKKVQSILKTFVFGMDIFACRLIRSKYEEKLKGTKPNTIERDEILSVLKGIRRYIYSILAVEKGEDFREEKERDCDKEYNKIEEHAEIKKEAEETKEGDYAKTPGIFDEYEGDVENE